MLYRDHIATWLGRGPCAVVNDIGIAEDFDPVDIEYATIGVVLHELAHVLERPALFDEQDCDNPDRLQFDALVLADASKRPSRSDLPMYFGHGLSFLRIAIHLAYRATKAGFDIKPAGIVAAHHLGLSPTAGYEDTLGDEPHRCLDRGFRALAVHRITVHQDVATNAHLVAQDLVTRIGELLFDLPAPGDDEHPIHWGHVGDLNEINHRLSAVIAFMTGTEK